MLQHNHYFFRKGKRRKERKENIFFFLFCHSIELFFSPKTRTKKNILIFFFFFLDFKFSPLSNPVQLNSLSVADQNAELPTPDSDANALNESTTSSGSERRKSAQSSKATHDPKSNYNNQTDSFDVNLKCNEFKEAINEVCEI